MVLSSSLSTIGTLLIASCGVRGLAGVLSGAETTEGDVDGGGDNVGMLGLGADRVDIVGKQVTVYVVSQGSFEGSGRGGGRYVDEEEEAQCSTV